MAATEQHGPSYHGNRWQHGLVTGCLGVLCFSGTLPATRLASPVFGPTVVTFARIDVAAVLGIITLAASGLLRIPQRQHVAGILANSLGGGLGYALFVGLAVEHVPAYHAAVIVGLTPTTTALITVLRSRERPRPAFWLGCALGLVTIGLFVLSQGGGSLHLADLWLLAAVLSTSVAYVEGASVSRELGAARMQCWSMIALAPFASLGLWPAITMHRPDVILWPAWAGLLYVGVLSSFLGAILWYRGLAKGGTARIGQLNLTQPLLSLMWAALLLHERVTWAVAATAAMVVISVALCINMGSLPDHSDL